MEPVRADSLFLQPQEVSVQLRPGVRQSFFITITRPSHQPIGDLTMEANPVPVGVNITFSYITNRSPSVVEVRKKHTDIVHKIWRDSWYRNWCPFSRCMLRPWGASVRKITQTRCTTGLDLGLSKSHLEDIHWV